jgi:hypothetical protein
MLIAAVAMTMNQRKAPALFTLGGKIPENVLPGKPTL